MIALSSRKAGGLRWLLRHESDAESFGAILANPEAFLQDPTLFYKNSRNVTLARIPAAHGRPALVLRRLNYGKRMHQVRDLFRPSRAHRGLRLALMLEEAGIPTARGYAASCVRRFRWPLRGYLLTEQIENATTVSQHLAEKGSEVTPGFIHAFADLLALLHNRGFSHRDLKLTNILVRPDGSLCFIDLDGVRQFAQVPLGRALRDLARMVQDLAPRWDIFERPACEFLNRYCQERKLADREMVGERVLEFAARKARQGSTLGERSRPASRTSA